MKNQINDASSTTLLINEAKRRNIAVISFPDIDPNTIILELGSHREPIYFSRTDHNGTVSSKITNNKILTTSILRHANFLVPDDIITDDIKEAETFLAKHNQVVVKPIGNTGGTGITTDVTSTSQLHKAFELARDLSFVKNKKRRAIFQQFVPGDDYRILVIGKRHIFSIQRIPAEVIGDGKLSVSELVNQWNLQRKSECGIQIDDIAQRLLQQQNLSLLDIPQNNQQVRLAGVANYHSGGSLHDATHLLGEEVKQIAIEVANYINLDVVGIDFISPDITNTPGHIIELNSTPDLTIHHVPDKGQPRNATGAVIDCLFPETAT